MWMMTLTLWFLVPALVSLPIWILDKMDMKVMWVMLSGGLEFGLGPSVKYEN
jgi:hypothetical protein